MLANPDAKIIFIRKFYQEWFPTIMLSFRVFMICSLALSVFIIIWIFKLLYFTAKFHNVWNFSCFCSWLILPIIDLFWISANYHYWRIFIFILSWELHFSIILCFVIIISFWLCRYLNRFKYVQHPKKQNKKGCILISQ